MQCVMCWDWCPEEWSGARKDKFIRESKDSKVDIILEKLSVHFFVENYKGRFSGDVQGEIWAQCVMCGDWCPEERARAQKDKFINYSKDSKVDIILEKISVHIFVSNYRRLHLSVISSNLSHYGIM